MARHIRRLFYVLAFASALAAPVALCQTAPVAVVPMALEMTGPGAGGSMQGLATYKASSSAVGANDRFYQRALSFSKAQVASSARSRMVMAVAGTVAISASMLALGYVLDEITRDVYATPPQPAPANPAIGTVVRQVTHSGHVDWGIDNNAACGHLGGAYYTGGKWACVANGAYTSSANLTSQMLNSTVDAWNPQPTPGISATDDEWASLVGNNPAAWPEPFHWPASPTNPNPNEMGQPRVADPMPQQMTDIQKQYRIDEGLAPKPEGEAEPVPVPQPDAAGEPAPDAPGSTENPAPDAVSLEFPAFCSWAPSVCALADWIQAPEVDAPNPEMPEKPIVSATWTSGLGAGSCPAPYMVTVAGIAHEATYQPYCDIAEGIKPFLLIMAALGAAFILARG